MHLISPETILLYQDFVQGPKLELMNVLELPFPIEILLGVLPMYELLGYLPQKLHGQGQMIFVPGQITSSEVTERGLTYKFFQQAWSELHKLLSTLYAICLPRLSLHAMAYSAFHCEALL